MKREEASTFSLKRFFCTFMANDGLLFSSPHTHAWRAHHRQLGTFSDDKLCLPSSPRLSLPFFCAALASGRAAELMIYINEPVDVWLPPSPHKHTREWPSSPGRRSKVSFKLLVHNFGHTLVVFWPQHPEAGQRLQKSIYRT